MMPAQPARSVRRAWAMASSVVYSATPAITGTLPSAASTAARSTASFSSGESELFSPSVPSMIRPLQPASRQARAWRWVLPRSRAPSCSNSVISAGNTPRQSTRIVSPPTASLPQATDTG